MKEPWLVIGGATAMAVIGLCAFAILSVLHHGDPGPVVDAIGVIISVIAALITWRALVMARISADAAKVSADAALLAANAAIQQVESMKRVERAYIDFSWDDIDLQDGFYKAPVYVVNDGKTPARITRVLVSRYMIDGNYPSVESVLDTSERATLTVGSGERLRIHTVRASPKDFTHILGVVCYLDTFDVERRSTMCIRLGDKREFWDYAGPPQWNHMS